jgi:hypothetical protein
VAIGSTNRGPRKSQGCTKQSMVSDGNDRPSVGGLSFAVLLSLFSFRLTHGSSVYKYFLGELLHQFS